MERKEEISAMKKKGKEKKKTGRDGTGSQGREDWGMCTGADLVGGGLEG